MRTKIAISIADLHLTLRRPACRADKDWMATQASYLQQVKDFAEEQPVLCAGDLFDRWNTSPELINFALKHLPEGMISIPGQHDLPNHQMEQMTRCGYGVLLETKKLRDLSFPNQTGNMGGYVIHGFGWNQEIKPLKRDGMIHVALVHRYFWTKGTSYPGAPEENNVTACKKQLEGYDIAITGDNHIPFIAKAGSCTVFNCGTFIRRKSDELHHKPGIGVIYSDGTIERKCFDTSIDVFQEEVEQRPEVAVNMKAFIRMLEELGEKGLNFKESVEHYLQKEDMSEGAKKIIRKSLE